jgi:hypothetical protein
LPSSFVESIAINADEDSNRSFCLRGILLRVLLACDLPAFCLNQNQICKSLAQNSMTGVLAKAEQQATSSSYFIFS